MDSSTSGTGVGRYMMKEFIIPGFLLFSSCSEMPPGPESGGLQLSLHDVSCTEAWIRVQTSFSRGTILMVRDGSAFMSFPAPASDTLVTDEGLAPGRSYAYQASRMGGGRGSALEVTEP